MESDQKYADQLHARAERSSTEARRTLLSISSGGVGVFVVALTGKTEPSLDLFQRLLVATGAISFGLAVLFSILFYKADAKRTYHQARALQSKDKEIRHKKYLMSSRMLKLKKMSSVAQLVAFGVGMASAILYTLLRAH